MTKKMIKPTIIALILLIFTLVIVLLVNKGKKSNYISRDAYDKKGFIDYDESLEDKQYKLKNDRFSFTLDANSTHFKLSDTKTGQVWNSSATEFDRNNIKDYNELFLVYYERVLEAPKSISVIKESVLYDNYSFKVNDSSIEVLYKVGGKRGVTFIDLPRKISEDRFNELIVAPLDALVASDPSYRRDVNYLKAQYKYQTKDKTFFLTSITNDDSIRTIYDLIFEKSLYTQEDYLKDSDKYNFPTSESIAYFEFAVEYELTNKGLQTKIVNDSIVDTESYQIAYIDVLPYLGAGMLDDEGFTVIPDGSGIYIDHQNGKYESTIYNKRIYGSDLSIGNGMIEKPEEVETVKLPMYAYSKNGHGFINAVEQSASMTNIISSFKTEVKDGKLVSKVPTAYYRYSLRERDGYEFESNTSSQRVFVWTDDFNTEDFVSQYIFLEEANNYYDVVEEYKEYLDENYIFGGFTADENLHLTFLGGYKQKKNFLGVPYNSVNYLTKSKEIQSVLDTMTINKYSVSYQGWSNDGIRPTKMDKIRFNNNVASKKDIKKLIKSMEDQNINMYLEYATQTGYTDYKTNLKKQVNFNLMQNEIGYYKYDLASNQFDNTTMRKFYYNEDQIFKNYQNVLKSSDKLNLSNIGIMDDGNELSTNFRTKDTFFRYEQIASFEKNNELLKDKSILSRGSNFYSILNADKLMDLPYEGSLHRTVDYAIPFLQLVLNGKVNYYTKSINLDTSNSLEYHKLKAIETGSKLQFTLSHQDTVDLIKTEYTDFYSTDYLNWNDHISKLSKELNDFGIFENTIINHKVLNKDGSIVEVTYSNGTKFQINYNTLKLIKTEGQSA